MRLVTLVNVINQSNALESILNLCTDTVHVKWLKYSLLSESSTEVGWLPLNYSLGS